MKKVFCLLVVLLALICGSCVTSVQARTARIFVIGNSFSGNATRYLPQLAKGGGHEVVIGRAERGAGSLQEHWEAVEAAEANPADPGGRIYAGGKTLHDLLSAGTWDIVTLQQYSFISSQGESYRPYARKLVDFVKTLQPQAEIVVHQTWAYRGDDKNYSVIAPGKQAQSANEMWQTSRAAYHAIAGELGARIIPVGDAFWHVSSAPRWGYKPDLNFNFAAPVSPALPDQTNSLHAGYSWATDKDGNPKLGFDSHHANDAGCYLGALVWYGFLFGESPEKLAFAPPTVPAPFAAYLRQVAWRTVQESARSIR